VRNNTHQKLQRRKRRIARRLARRGGKSGDRPVFSAGNIHYEVADRALGLGCGGIGVIHQVARQTGLIDAIDKQVQVLKVHLPYQESDHVLNIAYNVLAGGKCLDHLELLRNDEAYLNAVGASRIPDPTTAGDFCRRFENESQLLALMEAVNDVRLRVWKQQDEAFFEQAVLDADGILAPTTGQCKAGMNIGYNGMWGFHPLLISLANTKEPLYLLNRSGNRPSHERADEYLDKAIGRCRAAGFKHVLARGDTDFMQTWKLDEWDQSGDVTFIFGADARKEMIARAEQVSPADWRRLERPPKYQHKTDPPQTRARPENIKEQVVVERQYKNLVLQWEDVAEFQHRPDLCKQAYRMIALRKKISVEKGQEKLFEEYRYFFYITNDATSTAEEIVFSANDRCDQENLIAQLKDTGTGSMRNPLDNLFSNWAYMVISSLAWTLKAWCGLLLPATPGRHHQTHKQQGRSIVKMEFATFVNSLMRLPCQIIKSGRRIIYRLMSWNPWVSPLLRLSQQMHHPLRC
jgi:Transposase DDE domain group 1